MTGRRTVRDLESRGVARVAEKLSAEFALLHVDAREGMRITGHHVRTVDPPTVRLAVIKGREAFTLVPWWPEFLKQRGKEIEIGIQNPTISMALARQ